MLIYVTRMTDMIGLDTLYILKAEHAKTYLPQAH